jgi:hypothetical protein
VKSASQENLFPIVCGLLQVRVGVVLELPDQKSRVLLVSIALTRWFPERARKVFSKMSKMT